MHQNIERMKKKSFLLKILMYYIQKISFSPKQHGLYFFIGLREKITSFSFLDIFDAFELDVNVVNFVYYEKTRMHVTESLTFQRNFLQLIDFCG